MNKIYLVHDMEFDSLTEDKIICGCCGGVFEIEEIYDECEFEGWEPVVVFDDWIGLSEEILGD